MNPNNWSEVKDRIASKQLSSSSWASNQRHLLAILSKAEEWGLDPTDAARVSNTGWRTIVRPARSAIRHNDPDQLATLIKWAADLNIPDLRLKLGTPDLEVIVGEQAQDASGSFIRVFLTDGQLERIKQMTRLFYSIHIRGGVTD